MTTNLRILPRPEAHGILPPGTAYRYIPYLRSTFQPPWLPIWIRIIARTQDPRTLFYFWKKNIKVTGSLHIPQVSPIWAKSSRSKGTRDSQGPTARDSPDPTLPYPRKGPSEQKKAVSAHATCMRRGSTAQLQSVQPDPGRSRKHGSARPIQRPTNFSHFSSITT